MTSQPPSTNVWHYKPWWCQPWSIALTGIALISGSWLPFHRIWITAIVALPVLIWMGFFLIFYPQAVQQEFMQQEAMQQEALQQELFQAQTPLGETQKPLN